ncbi:hypothetical protein RJ498_002816 [Pluralibacter gergoviae]
MYRLIITVTDFLKGVQTTRFPKECYYGLIEAENIAEKYRYTIKPDGLSYPVITSEAEVVEVGHV